MSDEIKVKQAAEICDRGVAMIDEEIKNIKLGQGVGIDLDALVYVRENLEVMKETPRSWINDQCC